VGRPVKIALVVQGRFHAFDLARALIAGRHDVTVFTNYPHWAAARFGLPAHVVRSYIGHFVADRAIEAAAWSTLTRGWEPIRHQAFGRWAARELAREPWDIIHCWSGVSEEILHSALGERTPTLLMRGSSHIAFQRRLLDEESIRVSADLDRPSDWMVARERREYEHASRIAVLSTFAAQSFLDEGVPRARLSLLPLGVDVSAFRASPEAVAARCQRIRDGQRLTVLYAGTVSFRKGFWDLAEIIRTASASHFRFVLAGTVLPECRSLVDSLGSRVESLGPLPQAQLPEFYQEGDVFIFPTLEDGFGLVLTQARAAGLPILATTNCAARDLMRDNEDGWILPIREARAFVDQLNWCHGHREQLAGIARSTGLVQSAADWAAVAADFERICVEAGSWERTRQSGHMAPVTSTR
jgi:glycosyltransferase involved in cell wall biosynthesis